MNAIYPKLSKMSESKLALVQELYIKHRWRFPIMNSARRVSAITCHKPWNYTGRGNFVKNIIGNLLLSAMSVLMLAGCAPATTTPTATSGARLP
jgi:hypothetical protein